jgi:signal peptidase II
VTLLRRLPPWSWTPAVLLVDFVTKRLVLDHAEALRTPLPVLDDLLRFTYVRNPGAAMGLFSVGREVLIGVSIAAVVFLLYLYRRSDPRLRVRRGAIAAVIGGALGNLIDRVFYAGLVVDFIDVGIGDARFYTFNVADMGVTIGGAILFLCLLLEGRDQPPVTTTAPPRSPDDG